MSLGFDTQNRLWKLVPFSGNEEVYGPERTLEMPHAQSTGKGNICKRFRFNALVLTYHVTLFVLARCQRAFSNLSLRIYQVHSIEPVCRETRESRYPLQKPAFLLSHNRASTTNLIRSLPRCVLIFVKISSTAFFFAASGIPQTGHSETQTICQDL